MSVLRRYRAWRQAFMRAVTPQRIIDMIAACAELERGIVGGDQKTLYRMAVIFELSEESYREIERELFSLPDPLHRAVNAAFNLNRWLALGFEFTDFRPFAEPRLTGTATVSAIKAAWRFEHWAREKGWELPTSESLWSLFQEFPMALRDAGEPDIAKRLKCVPANWQDELHRVIDD